MRRTSSTFAALGALAFVACVAPFPDPAADTDATTGATTSGTATTDADDSTSTGTESDDGRESSTGSAGEAVLEIDGAPLVDFGLVQLGESIDLEIEVTNTGTATATSITAQSLTGAFSFPGDDYPGEGGDCSASLAAGESCTVVVRFAPDAPVSWQDELRVDYDGRTAATCDLEGGGISANLLQNPNAERGLTAWQIVLGLWTAECTDMTPHSGQGCFTSRVMTGNLTTHSVLRQDVDVGDWAELIDAGSIAFSFRGWARSASENNGDPWRFRVEFLDEDTLVEVGIDSDWEETYRWTPYEDGPVIAPVDTTIVGVVLECEKPSGHSLCDAFFDELELIALPAP
jgi:hypothetical protein